ncbi:MAG: amino acid ABC transporter permease [Euzebyales bacterium]|nr:amino acid ABC transporter permease [Euzebyales bacterium]
MLAYVYRWDVVTDNVDGLVSGLVITLEVTAAGFAIAVVLGLAVAVMRLAESPLLTGPARVYIEIMRGVPLFVFLFWVYYGVAQLLNVALSPFTAASLALGLTGAAYMAEIYRGALKAVDPGQAEAALAMGLKRSQAFRDVVLPQAVRVAIPPGMNLLIALLKGATLVSIIGVADMFYLARVVSLRTFTPFELYTVAGLVIVAVTIGLAGFAFLVERHLAAADRGTP